MTHPDYTIELRFGDKRITVSAGVPHVVGRGQTDGLGIDDPQVSFRHLVVWFDQVWQVWSEGRNGSFVNGQPIQGISVTAPVTINLAGAKGAALQLTPAVPAAAAAPQPAAWPQQQGWEQQHGRGSSSRRGANSRAWASSRGGGTRRRTPPARCRRSSPRPSRPPRRRPSRSPSRTPSRSRSRRRSPNRRPRRRSRRPRSRPTSTPPRSTR